MELINQIMTGDDLRIFLRPKSAFIKGNNSYYESLSLPHIFVEGMTFWGHTLTHHIRLNEGESIPFHRDTFKETASFYASYKTGFFYSNYRGGMFGEINLENPDIGTSGFARLDFGYTEHTWITKNNYIQIFNREDIGDAIRNGQKLKVMIEIEKEKWATMSSRYYIGEVFLPYLFDSGEIYFLCSPFTYIDASLSRRALDAAQKKYIKIKGISNEQYLISMDGEYIHLGNAEGWNKGKWRKTKEVKVFAEIGDTTMQQTHQQKPEKPEPPSDHLLREGVQPEEIRKKLKNNKSSRFRDRIWKLFHTPNIA